MTDYRTMTRNVAAQQWPNDRRAQDIFFRKIQAESGFRPDARSPAGALGIAQIVPKWHPGVDPMNPLAALRYSARHDAQNFAKYGNWQDALSVYNSGRPWAEGQGIAETRNYVQKILGGTPAGAGRQGAPPMAAAPLATAAVGASPGASQNPRALFAMNLIQAMNQQGDQQNMGLLNAIQSLRPPVLPPSPTAPSGLPAGATAPGRGPGGGGGSGVRELFYDPLGAYDEGNWINPIGGHDDHVHVSFGTPQAALRIIKQAQQLGLRVSENPYVDKVDPVHTKGSYHYRTFPATNIGQGLDTSGDPAKMAALFNWIRANYLGRSR